MPKLNGDQAERVANAETLTYMQDGLYEMELVAVMDTDKKTGQPLAGPKGAYWKWDLQVPADAERYASWHQWLTTSLSPEADPIMKRTFAAFGVTTDTDTDDLIGRRVLVKVYTYEYGGETRASVDKLLPLEDGVPAASGGGKVSPADLL